jgi:hypothetical protein
MKKYLPLRSQSEMKGLPLGDEKIEKSSLKILETVLSKAKFT